jgi:hypothetical protein
VRRHDRAAGKQIRGDLEYDDGHRERGPARQLACHAYSCGRQHGDRCRRALR